MTEDVGFLYKMMFGLEDTIEEIIYRGRDVEAKLQRREDVWRNGLKE